MNLQQLDSLSDDQRELLEADHWTVSRLATATTKQLTAYHGIGEVRARRVISEARTIVAKAGLAESRVVILPVDEDPPPMSVRVRRIYDANRNAQ